MNKHKKAGTWFLLLSAASIVLEITIGTSEMATWSFLIIASIYISAGMNND